MQVNNRIKVLLAEDEPVISRGIREQLERLDSEFVVTAEVENGADAVTQIQKQVPDVLFTDIRMPEMDGIELIRWVRLRYPQVKVVILSGYSDFTYMQQAIRYGVSHYLLKPVEDDALRETLTELKNELLRERLQPQRTAIRPADYRDHNNMNLSRILFEVCVGNLCYDLSDEYMQDFYKDHVQLDWERIASHLMDGMVDWQVSEEEAPNQKLISCRFQVGQQPDVSSAAVCLTKRIKEQLPGVPVTVCFSRELIPYEDVWMFTQRLRNLLRQGLLPGTDRIMCLEKDELLSSDELMTIVRMRVNDQLRQSIENDDSQQIQNELEMIIKYMVDHEIPHRDIQKIISHIIHICELCNKGTGENSYKNVMRILSCTNEANSLPEKLVESLMDNYWQSPNHGDLGARLVEYVDQHFLQLKNLESLSKVFQYNYAYLSRLFKKQTGVTLNRYVQERKLNLAKQFIENRAALNIEQIGSMAGFTDHRYFLRAFKAYTGQSPSEYRKSLDKK